MFKINGNWIEISDIELQNQHDTLKIKQHNIIKKDVDSNIYTTRANVNKKTNDFLFNFAKIDEYKSVLNIHDLKQINNEFNILRKKNKDYKESEEKNRVKVVSDRVKLLLGLNTDADLQFDNIKTKRNKTIIKFKLNETVEKNGEKVKQTSIVKVNIKKDKITITVKEDSFFNFTPEREVVITDNQIKSSLEDDKLDYNITFMNKTEDFLLENEYVDYRNRQGKVSASEENPINLSNISNIWDIDLSSLEAANADFKDIENKRIKIPTKKARKAYKYKIEEGDTYRSLAKKLNIDINLLKEANFVLPEVGTKITIPKNEKHTLEEKYIVKENDTIESVMKLFGVTKEELIKANNKWYWFDKLKPVDIEEGKTITIPETTFNEDEKYYKYRVEKGDTLEDVAKEHNINIVDIKVENKNLRGHVEDSRTSTIIVPECDHHLKVKRENIIDIPARDYIVQPGDSGISIANELGVLYTELKDCNDGLNNLKAGQIIKIPAHKKIVGLNNNSFRAVAEETGVSESYIIDILLGIEVGLKKLSKMYDVCPYNDSELRPSNPDSVRWIYDPKKWNKTSNGDSFKSTLTIGYGHTNRVFGIVMTLKNYMNIKITDSEAKLLLAQDILNAKAEVEYYFGKENFYKLPISLQEALIDVAYNKGLDGFNRSGFDKKNGKKTENGPAFLKEHFNNYFEAKTDEERVSALKNMVYDLIFEPTTATGLKVRNLYRIILACRDLDNDLRIEIMNDLEYYYKHVYAVFSTDRRIGTRSDFSKDWLDAKENGWFEENKYERSQVYDY